MSVYIPKGYKSHLNLIDTQYAIKIAKDNFEKKLSEKLSLIRVSAPLFVYPETGLNDNLSGSERPVSFEIKETGKYAEIVHSLAKWKRYALGKYKISYDNGIYTDMNAIRRDEELDNLHSIYVDQWDWEKVIAYKDRTREYLIKEVKKIVEALSETKEILLNKYKQLKFSINKEVFFINSENLLKMYPNNTTQERENLICKEKKTVFIIGIGAKLSNNLPHDNRAPDYDDWNLNGDLLIWHPLLNKAVELSSMGIRVDKKTLITQCEIARTIERLNLPFHKSILEDKIPLSIGGGIGQSRLCLVLLEKIHIGEVQASIWSDDDVNIFNINQLNIL
ncbi:MAG: aspartate--ammonia ligase [Bacilli bacterium]